MTTAVTQGNEPRCRISVFKDERNFLKELVELDPQSSNQFLDELERWNAALEAHLVDFK